jgi:hypothetical protein
MSAPKEGDKRHGAHGDEIFHNGHWIPAGGKGDHAKENEHGKEHH